MLSISLPGSLAQHCPLGKAAVFEAAALLSEWLQHCSKVTHPSTDQPDLRGVITEEHGMAPDSHPRHIMSKVRLGKNPSAKHGQYQGQREHWLGSVTSLNDIQRLGLVTLAGDQYKEACRYPDRFRLSWHQMPPFLTSTTRGTRQSDSKLSIRRSW